MLQLPEGLVWRIRMLVFSLLFLLPGSVALEHTCNRTLTSPYSVSTYYNSHSENYSKTQIRLPHQVSQAYRARLQRVSEATHSWNPFTCSCPQKYYLRLMCSYRRSILRSCRICNTIKITTTVWEESNEL